MATPAERPALSLVVAVTDGLPALRRLLADLAAQRDTPALEVIVVDGTGRIAPDDVAGASRGVETRLLAVAGADVVALRAVGVRAARGALIALTEDHCRLPADWCARLLRTQAVGHRAFGGPIDNGSFRAPPDWAAYLVEYSAFMPPLPAGPITGLSAMNAGYERALVEDLPDATLCEPILHRRLRDRGVALHLEPGLVVALERRFGVSAFTRHCFAGGRMFASLRMAPAPILPRLAYALAAATALPLVLPMRIGARVCARRRAGRVFLLALPWVVLYTAAWSLGEAVGALTARGEQSRPTPVTAPRR